MTTVIVGGGLAGLVSAESLRELGYQDRIVMVGAEPHRPYDRPPLSKDYLHGSVAATSLDLRAGPVWEALHVDRRSPARVARIDSANGVAVCDSGEEFEFDHLIWAAGGQPRRFSGPGADLDGVHYLRTIEDADALRQRASTASNAVIVGGGYIGLEVAAALVKMGVSVAVLEAQDRLLARVTSEAVSSYYHSLHTGKGVQIMLQTTAKAFLGDGGKLSAVETSGGDVIPAELVVVGIGLVPGVQPLADAGAACGNGVDTDDVGRTSLAGAWAVGDCANFKGMFTRENRVRLESVHNATHRAKRVAASIMAQQPPPEELPWSWSNQYDVKMKSAGLSIGFDEAIMRGSVSVNKFSVLYLREDRLIAVDTVNSVRDYAQARKILSASPSVPLSTRLGLEDIDTPIADLVRL